MTRERLAGKTAIVTGGTAGIGEAVTRLFVDEGACVVTLARRTEPGQRLAAELGERVVFIAGDVATETTAERAVAAAHKEFGRLDVLVNNAAMDFFSDLLETDVEDVRQVLQTNFVGPFLMLRAAGRAMREGDGGAIVNVVSRNALVGVPSFAIYGAAKGALLSLTRAAAVELASLAIRVNAVAPGLTNTPLVRAWIETQENPAEFERAKAATIPQRRFAEPLEVAAAIVFLASDEAAHITGALLSVDGGYTAA